MKYLLIITFCYLFCVGACQALDYCVCNTNMAGELMCGPKIYPQQYPMPPPNYPIIPTYPPPSNQQTASNPPPESMLAVYTQNQQSSIGNAYAQYSQSEIVGDPFRPCAENEFQCSSPKQCIPIIKRCNDYVECVDGSDERDCTCPLRLKPEKLCDSYYDCPNGEDELGCFGCGKDQYSCYRTETEYKNTGSYTQCYYSHQNCDKLFNCFNGRDEMGCARILKEVISSTESLVSTTDNGVLHYLQRGQLYPVCVDELGWSRDVCHGLLGNNFRDVEITYQQTEYKGLYVQNSHSIKSATFVNECPGKEFNYRNVLMRVNCLSKTSCGSYRVEAVKFSRIAGGYETISQSNPWLVGLFVNGDFRCGGIIISKKWILTAAHCLHDEAKRLSSKNHYVEVRAGIRRLSSFSSNQQTLRVARGLIHEDFNKTNNKNDIALLELENAITLNSLVQPICLPTAAHVGDSADLGWIWGPKNHSLCKIAGWGSHTRRGLSPVDRQMEVNVPIEPTCDPNNTKFICAGFEEGGFDACVGDSGGPLVCRSKTNDQDVYLAGIVSGGFSPEANGFRKTQCGRKGTYGTYTGITWYIRWIESNQKEMEQNQTHGVRFQEICPGVMCSSSPNFCAPVDGFPDCIDGEDEVINFPN